MRAVTRRLRTGAIPAGTDHPTIGHVIDSLSISGGAEKQLIANLNALEHSDLRNEVILMKDVPDSRLDDLPATVGVTVLFENGEQPRRIEAIRRLAVLLRAEHFDLVHAALPTSALAARAAGRLTGTPVVESLVNISHEAVRVTDNPNVTLWKLRAHTLLDQLTMRWVTAFHAVGETVARSWHETVGIDPSKITVIPRGIDPSLFESLDEHAARKSVREEFGWASDAYLVLSVGRLEPQKGHRYLLEAAALARDRIGELRVLIAGRGGLSTPALEAQILELGLEDIVVLAGPRRDVRRLLTASDVFAFPSLFEGNGGNAMIEAMAAGVPIVTTHRPPMTELIPDERFGILIELGDSRALAAALERLHREPETAALLGSAAQQRAMGFLSPEEVSDRYRRWYEQLVERAAPT
jgi:glycosyltransferase involved in cell wall biosynthesis